MMLQAGETPASEDDRSDRRPPDGFAAAPSGAAAVLEAARPRQALKNLLLFAAFLFTLGHLPVLPALARAAAGFLSFTLLASAAYILNDVRDAEADRLHPVKRRRPVASGRLGVTAAVASAVILAGSGMAVAFVLGLPFAGAAALFLALTLAYTFALKRIVLLDVMALALGYVLRAVAGAAAIGVQTSFWLAACTFLLALFLGLCKRRAELVSLVDAAAHRESLADYTHPLLDQLVSVVTASAVVAYALYTYFTPTSAQTGTVWLFRRHLLAATIPFVVYGVFRYLYLVYVRGRGASPEEVFLGDRALQWNTLLWALACVAAVLAGRYL